MTAFGTITEIWRYPVSSMGGERLSETEIAAGGLPGDRIWGVVDRRDGDVAAPEKRRHWRPLPNLLSRLHDGHPHVGDAKTGKWLRAGDTDADALVSSVLEFDAGLQPHIPFGDTSDGHVAPRYQRADLHIVTTASMAQLASLLPDPAEVDSRRFRPNLVIETPAYVQGFVEHTLIGRTLEIGTVRIEIVEPCARCSFTALAQGELAFEPAVLHKISAHGEGGFGVLCKVVQTGDVRLGDQAVLIPA